MIHGEGNAVVDVAHDLVVVPESVAVLDRIPEGAAWRYEPDWDGLRVSARGGAGGLWITSERDRPMGRYFPEIVDALSRLPMGGVTLRGSLVVMRPEGFSFDLLRRRIHPSAARVAEVATLWPATFVLTDLVRRDDLDVRAQPLERRRDLLVEFAERAEVATMPARLGRLTPGVALAVTPQTYDVGVAVRWLGDRDGVGRDGLIAKHADGRTDVRVRRIRRAACVVTGIRSSGAAGLRSLRLGMFDGNALVDVGRTGAFRSAPVRREATAVVAAVAPGARGGVESTAWVDVVPSLVCEVEFERLRAGRFRQAVRFVGWLESADPRSCRVDQLR